MDFFTFSIQNFDKKVGQKIVKTLEIYFLFFCILGHFIKSSRNTSKLEVVEGSILSLRFFKTSDFFCFITNPLQFLSTAIEKNRYKLVFAKKLS